MPKAGDSFTVTIKKSHIDWGDKTRNPTNRDKVKGESYVKIPAEHARKYDLIRGSEYNASFTNDSPSIKIKSAGNGPADGKYGKQFEGIGSGACKAFTPWYKSCGAKVGDIVKAEFTSSTDVKFTLI